jgi:hypothetical protein
MRVLDRARDDAQPGLNHHTTSSKWDSPARPVPHAGADPAST